MDAQHYVLLNFHRVSLALLRELSGPSDPGVLMALIVLVAFVVLMVLVALVGHGLRTRSLMVPGGP